MSRPRVAVVVHRYGATVGGGAEEEARRIAHLLHATHEVTVLTTCATDYRTWADDLPAGAGQEEGIPVVRFPVPVPRDPDAFDRMTPAAYAAPEDLEVGSRWMDAQGPNAPGLLAHLAEHGRGYDAVVFVTYLYATTVRGLPLVADRALLVPTLHDEPPARLRIFDPVFGAARRVMCNTPEELDLVRARFGVDPSRCTVMGFGVDPVPEVAPGAFAARRGITRPYVLCVGRLDAAKGVDRLVEDHRAYRAANPGGADLVLVGRGELRLPDEPWLHRTGFVEDLEKHEAIAGAAVVVVPSPYESLSIAQLDAWSHARPTLANAASPVLVGQSRRTAGGLWYDGTREYVVMLDFLVSNPAAARAIGRQGRAAVRVQHSWDRVAEIWRASVDAVAAEAAG